MKTDAHEVIELRVGEEQIVTLPGMASGGYRWTPEEAGDEKVAEIAGRSVRLRENALAGESADEVFTLRGLGLGTTRMHFLLSRPWESGSAAREHVIEVRVTN